MEASIAWRPHDYQVKRYGPLNAHRRSECLVKDTGEAGHGMRYDLKRLARHSQERGRTTIARDDRDPVTAGQRFGRKLACRILTPRAMK
jgi:hypothetical protein